MSFFAFVNRPIRLVFFIGISLFISIVTLAQVNLTYRMLSGYFLSNEQPISKTKPTLFVLAEADGFNEVFKPAATSKRPDKVNFAKETVLGIALPPTNKPPKLSISRVFVQDSVLTVRYIRIKDTTLTNNPQSFTSQPLLLLTIPKQNFLKTKLVENGKVVLTMKKSEED